VPLTCGYVLMRIDQRGLVALVSLTMITVLAIDEMVVRPPEWGRSISGADYLSAPDSC
jgi:hypothetical protein